MTKFQPDIEQLRTILAHLSQPGKLDDHPWVEHLVTQDQPGSSPGEKLAHTVRQIFRKMMPAHPPRQGKRLDTRWGAFGILAAQYFVPIEFNLPPFQTQREAWLGIDQAILLYVFGPNAEISSEQRQQYCLVGNEPEIAPNSTISGWHRKGMEMLLEMVTQQAESHKIVTASFPVQSKTTIWKKVALVLGFVIFTFVVWLSLQGYHLYQQTQLVMRDVNTLKPYLSQHLQVDDIAKIAAQVSTLRTDLNVLQKDAEPFLWLAPGLGWVPTYGGDISQSPKILELATSLVAAADEGLQAIRPVVDTASAKDQPLDMLAVLNQLQRVQPRLLAAQLALAQGQEARKQINDNVLSEKTRSLLKEQIDPLLQKVQGKFRMDDALMLVKSAPSLLGVGKAGPKTYMLLIQNEDELRPTGGFITAVGSVVLKDGKLWDISIEGSDLINDLSKPYPRAPWQLDKYMGLPILVFRDSNWFTDFPTTALMAEYLYSYTRAHGVDGVITINQNVVVELLKILGPIRVQGVIYDITSENVLQYMRTAKEQKAPPGVVGPWDRKQFIGRLAKPLLEKILAARGDKLSTLSQTLITLLDQRYILMQFDDPDLTAFLAKHKWDGAVRPPVNSDFLLVVDTNVGYNKTSLVTKTSLAYDVDLTNLAKPVAKLTVRHTNQSTGDVPCEILPPVADEEKDYPINECYWTYLRIYTPAGTKLLSASPHAVPANETMDGTAVPAQTDDLGSEDIPGVHVFGTLVVIPQRQTLQTGFELELPVSILQQSATHEWTYHLTIQKQAGTKPAPLALRLFLPDEAKIIHATQGLTSGQGFWFYNTTLTQDIVIEITFSMAK